MRFFCFVSILAKIAPHHRSSAGTWRQFDGLLGVWPGSCCKLMIYLSELQGLSRSPRVRALTGAVTQSKPASVMSGSCVTSEKMM